MSGSVLFGLGIFVGACIGVFVMCLMNMAARGREGGDDAVQ
jgi:hypothetical protein